MMEMIGRIIVGDDASGRRVDGVQIASPCIEGVDLLTRHFRTEEEELIPRLAEHLPSGTGPIHVVLTEHEEIRAIVELKLGKVRERIWENHGAELSWEEEVVEEIVARCTVEESGARNVDSVLAQTVLPGLAEKNFSYLPV